MCQLFAQSSSSHGPYISIEWVGDTGEVWVCKGAKGACAFQFGCCTLPEVAQRLKSYYYRGSARLCTGLDYGFRSPVAGLTPVNPPSLNSPAVCFIALTPATLAKPLASSPASPVFPIEASRKTLIAFFTLVLPLRLTRTWF